MTDDRDDDLVEAELEPTLDEALEAARHGERVDRPATVGPAIGSQRIVREDLPTPSLARTVFRCSCGLLTAGWHAGHEPGAVEPLTAEEWDGVGEAQAEGIAEMQHATRLHKHLEWGPDQWRAIPGWPTYSMNGYTREVRREAYVRTCANGVVRLYKEQPVKAHRSGVKLSREGGPQRHLGIEGLWRLTFPEYATDPDSMNTIRVREKIPSELRRVVQNPR